MGHAAFAVPVCGDAYESFGGYVVSARIPALQDGQVSIPGEPWRDARLPACRREPYDAKFQA